MTDKKECTLCHQVKPLTEFWREKNNKTGRAARCKVCDEKRKLRLIRRHLRGTCQRCNRPSGGYAACESCRSIAKGYRVGRVVAEVTKQVR